MTTPRLASFSLLPSVKMDTMQPPTTGGSGTNVVDEMGSLARLDSLDEYFMLHSPPDSPNQQGTRKSITTGASPNMPQVPTQQEAQAPTAGTNHNDAFVDAYGYFGSNDMASQGNIQTPTLNFSVDRSNAVHHQQRDNVFSRLLPSTQKDIDEMLKMDDKDVNLSELFLQSNQRRSLNNNYQAKGALRGHDNDLHKTRSNSLTSSFLEDQEINAKTHGSMINNNSNSNMGGMANGNNAKQSVAAAAEVASMNFDFDVEPTPLAEIRAKTEQRKMAPNDQQQQQGNRGLTAQTLEHHDYKQNRQQRLQHGSSYYPFGRSYQLPIPTMPPISPTRQQQPQQDQGIASTPQQPMADPVATAAALATTQQATTDSARGSTGHHSPYPPPNSPQPSQASSHTSTWQPADGSRPESRNSTASQGSYHHHHHHHQSPSIAAQQPPQHPPPVPYPHQQQQQQQHSQHPHNPAAPSYHLGQQQQYHGHKIVGPYTTAQQDGSSATGGLGRRRISSVSSASTIASKNSTVAPAPASPSPYLPRRGEHMPREASAAHVTPKGVHAEATNQRRGHIGFHKPATSQTTNTYHHPLPSKYPNYAPPSTANGGPAFAKKPTTTTMPAIQATTTLNSTQNTTVGAPAAAPPAAAASHATSDSAYERKKQRAKDARVKLNESIERLHVSMGLAGTESKKRAEQLLGFMKQAGREHENSTDHQAFELMQDCVKTAESAKKWDRPNFVGSAATMIQCLNSQCEILMKELMEYQEAARMQQQPMDASRPPPPPLNGESLEQDPGAQFSSAPSNGKRPSDGSTQDIFEDPAMKRRRLDEDGDGAQDEKKESATLASRPVSPGLPFLYPAMGGPPIRLNDRSMALICAFLDPGSLVTCMSVCKAWRDSRFASDETWLNLSIQRFGISNVRHWQEQHADDEDDDDRDHQMEDNQQSGDFIHKSSGIKMYKAMDEQSIMPWLQQQDGGSNLLIGKARLPGVAAWMYLVQRSNGETMRSVRRPQTMAASSRNTGVYTSLPVVELRIVIQNTGGGKVTQSTSIGAKRDSTIVIKDQPLVVDASTRRRGEELLEIDFDERFAKKILHADGSMYVLDPESRRSNDDLAHVRLFETIVVVGFIHARRCSTTTKFRQRSKFLKLLLQVNGTTQALVIPVTNQQSG